MVLGDPSRVQDFSNVKAEAAEEMMTGWYPGWQMTVAWLVVTAVAAAIHFGPMTQLVESFGD